ncbi:MAG: Trm112 family protein [Rickettsiales bacterium]|nr:Trm112 family protein [Rickettsiales bacterium]
MSKEDQVVAVNQELLDILVCPLTKTELVYDKKKNELVSKKAGLAYPVRDGIPVMLIDEARKIESD